MQDAKFGMMIENRYKIGSKFGIGSFGSIYEVTDIQDPEAPLVIKFNKHVLMNKIESQVMKKLTSHYVEHFPMMKSS